MPFPPVFTNVWDTTFPPDTQLANLLGQDLRQVRTDVMQRLSLLSGTFANRPAPEILNATWGGVGFGLLYFATDTSQIFQWNGAAWIDVSNSIRGAFFKDNAAHVHTGTVTDDVIDTTVINGNSLGASGLIRATLVFIISAQGAGGNSNVKFKYGGTVVGVYTLVNAAAGFTLRADFTMGNQGVTNSQKNTLAVSGYTGALQTTVSFNTTAIDSTVNQNFTVTVQNFAVGDSQTFHEFFLESL
jgi:hypothetical protein